MDIRFLKSLIDSRLRTSSDKKPTIPSYAYRGSNTKLPSLGITGGLTECKHDAKIYTGTKMLGIATMHKSNSVPVFSQDEAESISKMRR